ncbi:hypothetical protein CEQ90_02930 [Lewinellaceae bacterium SD302]|nr:hypothetical protein CEQ90_02930 [Lewinellaceae bacterium SD302]
MRYLLILLVGLLCTGLFAQNNRLAQKYYQDGEYEKAAQLYLELSEGSQNNDFFYSRYVTSLMKLERYDEAESALKKKLRRQPEAVKLYVIYGQLLEDQGRGDEAEEKYREAIQQLGSDQYQITQLANAFMQQTKYELAIATYERGAEMIGDDLVFSYNLGDLYRRKGDPEPMITNYLNAVEAMPKRAKQVRTIFQRYLSKEELKLVQKELYARIQADTEGKDDIFPSMLSWVFVQRKDYAAALRQDKALDRRLDENGNRIYQLGQLAANDRDYGTAIKAFDYIVEEKGPTSTLYLDAKREGLVTRRRSLTDGYDYSQEDLRILETAYDDFLAEFGNNPAVAPIVIQLAELEALYLNDTRRAINLLDGLIQQAGVPPRILAEAKLSLADYYLITGDIWEATLLYSQVDKAFKEDLLGHEARFRNARLSYFRGDFEWAQSQFDVLKASTSKLIANDALDLSVFIIDNLGLDTTTLAMQTYADAELLVFQNRFDEAFAKMDSLVAAFPGHDLEDDIFYLKADIHRRKREYDLAATIYEKIIADYPESIRLDNSIWNLAQLFENQLDDKVRAQELYETLFIDYSNSILAVEARKKYRELRGDELQ